MRKKKHILQPYGVRLMLIKTSKTVRLSRTKIKEPFAHTIWGSIKENGLKYNCIYVVLNPKNKYKKLTAGTIAHEAFHVSEFVFEIIKEEAPGSEAQAYLIEYVSNLIEKFLK